ncbi:MAG: hypothetical protein ACOZBH_03265 [Patescibacteria group bacterium]
MYQHPSVLLEKPRPGDIKRLEDRTLKEKKSVNYLTVRFDEEGRPEFNLEKLKELRDSFIDFLSAEKMPHDEKFLYLEEGIRTGQVTEQQLMSLIDRANEDDGELWLEFDQELLDYLLTAYPQPEKFANFILSHEGIDADEYPDVQEVLKCFEMVDRENKESKKDAWFSSYNKQTMRDAWIKIMSNMSTEQSDKLMDFIARLSQQNFDKYQVLIDPLFKNYDLRERKKKTVYKKRQRRKEEVEGNVVRLNDNLWRLLPRFVELKDLYGHDEYIKKYIELRKRFHDDHLADAEVIDELRKQHPKESKIEIRKRFVNKRREISRAAFENIYEEMTPRERGQYFYKIFREEVWSEISDTVREGKFKLDEMEFTEKEKDFLIRKSHDEPDLLLAVFDLIKRDRGAKYLQQIILNYIQSGSELVSHLIQTGNFDTFDKKTQKALCDAEIASVEYVISDKLLQFSGHLDVFDIKKWFEKIARDADISLLLAADKVFNLIKRHPESGLTKEQVNQTLRQIIINSPVAAISKPGVRLMREIYPEKEAQLKLYRKVASSSAYGLLKYLSYLEDGEAPELDRRFLLEQVNKLYFDFRMHDWNLKGINKLLGGVAGVMRFVYDHISGINPEIAAYLINVHYREALSICGKILDYYVDKNPSAVLQISSEFIGRKKNDNRFVLNRIEQVLKRNPDMVASESILRGLNDFIDIPEVGAYLKKNIKEIISRNPTFTSQNARIYLNYISEEEFLEIIQSQEAVYAGYVIDRKSPLLAAFPQLNRVKILSKYPHVLYESGFYKYRIEENLPEVYEQNPLDFLMNSLKDKAFYGFWRQKLEKEAHRLQKSGAVRISPTIESLAEKVCVLSGSRYAGRIADEIGSISGESDREKYLDMAFNVINLGLESKINARGRILTQLISLLRGEADNVFGISAENVDETSVIFKEMEPFLTHFRNQGNIVEVRQLMREVIDAELNGVFYNWRFWDAKKPALGETDKEAGLKNLKQKGLLPDKLTMAQYEEWIAEDSSSLAESFSYEINEVREELFNILRYSLDNSHAELSMSEFSIDEAQLRFLLADDNMRNINVELSQIRKIIAQNKQRAKEGQKPLEYDEDRLEALTEQFELAKEELNQRKIRSFISRIIHLTAREVLDGGVYLKGVAENKGAGPFVPFGKVFAFLRNAYSSNQAFHDDLDRMENVIAQYRAQEAGEGLGKEEYTFTDTADILTMIKIGADPVASCQSYKSESSYATSLMSYVADPNTKAFIVKKPDGSLVARAIARLLSDEGGNPFIVLEPMYSVNTHPRLQVLLANVVKQKAAKLGIKAVVSRGGYPAGGEPAPVLYSRGSRNINTYVDNIGSKAYKGKYQIAYGIEL